ncbi:hypothetical protein, partial [Salmonella sp. s54925]|uniref:hypothetical protein n=1 Tax=Salmonella sp. s54925 TaxID=3159674 RepID=UPI0039812D7D
ANKIIYCLQHSEWLILIQTLLTNRWLVLVQVWLISSSASTLEGNFLPQACHYGGRGQILLAFVKLLCFSRLLKPSPHSDEHM